MRTEPTSLSIFAFLSVLDVGEPGFIGGLLLLNRSGRPVEFHCTTPVRANRAQQILYGPTLRPYLFAEQIGTALLGKMKSKPDILFTNCAAIFELRDTLHKPVVLVRSGTVVTSETGITADSPTSASTNSTTLPPPHSPSLPPSVSSMEPTSTATMRTTTNHDALETSSMTQILHSTEMLPAESELLEFSLGRNRFAVPAVHAEDRTLVSTLLRELANWFDFTEPFGRITEAVNEARRAA